MRVQYLLDNKIIKVIRNGAIPLRNEAVTLSRNQKRFPVYRVEDVVRNMRKNTTEVVIKKLGIAERPKK